MMKKIATFVFALCLSTQASGQWQVPDHTVPIGRGVGFTGFKSVGPCAVGAPFIGAGASADPICGPAGVNLRGSSETAYTIQASDLNKVIIARNDTAAVAWTLAYAAGFTATLNNAGRAPVTVTVSSGLINGQKTVVLGYGQASLIVADGTGNYRSMVFPATSQSDSAINAVSAPSYSLLTLPVSLTLSGTVTAGNVIGFDYNYTQAGPQTIQFRHTMVGGDTLQTAAVDLQNQIRANATLQTLIGYDAVSHAIALKVGSNWVVAFNQTWPMVLSSNANPTVTAVSGGTTTVTAGGGGITSEFVSEVVIGNSTRWAGRTPLAGDILGGVIVTGDTTTTNMQLRDAVPFYSQLVWSIIDPTEGVNSSKLSLGVKIAAFSDGVTIGPIALPPSTGQLLTSGTIKSFTNTAIPAGGAASTGYFFSSALEFGMFFGSGAPTVSAAQGSIYLRSDGNPYVNTNGSTAWTQLLTTTGSVSCAQMPALTGDVTTTAGSCATTLTTAQPAVHTWALAQTFTVAPVFTDQSGSRTALGLGALATVTPGTGIAAALAINVGSAGAPVLFNGAGGTPSSLVGTNISGTAASLTAGNVTTNANLTGPIISAGNATSIASQTGTGTKFVVDTAPTISSLTVTTAFTATGLVGLPNLATQTANTILMNATSGVASPTAVAAPSCSTAASALQYTTSGGASALTCNSSITAAAVPASGLTGATLAAGVTASSLTSLGTIAALVATQITSPLHYGGAGAASNLTLASTSGAGTTDYFAIQTGSQLERMRILTGGNVGFGSNNPQSKLHINANTVQNIAPTNTPVLQISQVDGSTATLEIDAFGANASFTGRSAAGTAGSPTGVTAGAQIMNMFGYGYNGATYIAVGGMIVSSAEAGTFTAGNNGTKMQIYTTPVGSATTAPSATFQASGGFSIGTSNTADSGNGTIKLKPQAFASLTACSSTIEGALASITDSSTIIWGATITGSSTNHVFGYCDGTNWTVAAK